MPNGGFHHCAGCCHYQKTSWLCALRNIEITNPAWTTCKNRNNKEGAIDGPIYAIVCEVKNGAGSYGDIPYFDDARVDTHQESGADTVVRFKDSSGTTHQFATVDEYMSFYKASGREL